VSAYRTIRVKIFIQFILGDFHWNYCSHFLSLKHLQAMSLILSCRLAAIALGHLFLSMMARSLSVTLAVRPSYSLSILMVARRAVTRQMGRMVRPLNVTSSINSFLDSPRASSAGLFTPIPRKTKLCYCRSTLVLPNERIAAIVLDSNLYSPKFARAISCLSSPS